MKRFSKLTIGFGLYIIISASFMRQVRSFLIGTFGDQALRVGFLTIFFLVVTLYLIYIYRSKVTVGKIGLSLFVFALAFLLILLQRFFAERLHVLEYGILGYLALRDLSLRGKYIGKNIIYMVCFVSMVSLLDEGFQWILPYRYFDVRDLATNMISGILGATQYFIYRN